MESQPREGDSTTTSTVGFYSSEHLPGKRLSEYARVILGDDMFKTYWIGHTPASLF